MTTRSPYTYWREQFPPENLPPPSEYDPKKQSRERARRMEAAVLACMKRGLISKTKGSKELGPQYGVQVRLAEHFKVSRQRIAQVVRDVRRELESSAGG